MTYTILSGRERTYQSWWGVPEVALNGTAEDIRKSGATPTATPSARSTT